MKLLIHPFLEEVARWTDADYVEMHRSWGQNSLGARLNAILEVFSDDLAVKDASSAVLSWEPAERIKAIVGPSGPDNHVELELDNSFLRIPADHLESLNGVRRHAFDKTVISFRCYNQGLIKVDGRDAVGLRRWKPTKLGRRAIKSFVV